MSQRMIKGLNGEKRDCVKEILWGKNSTKGLISNIIKRG